MQVSLCLSNTDLLLSLACDWILGRWKGEPGAPRTAQASTGGAAGGPEVSRWRRIAPAVVILPSSCDGAPH